jgi:hypothetical protein
MSIRTVVVILVLIAIGAMLVTLSMQQGAH